MTKEEIRKQIKEMEEHLEELEMIKGFLTIGLKLAKLKLEDGTEEEKEAVFNKFFS